VVCGALSDLSLNEKEVTFEKWPDVLLRSPVSVVSTLYLVLFMSFGIYDCDLNLDS